MSNSPLENQNLATHEAYTSRLLPKPTQSGMLAYPNELPEFIDGEWVLGWILVTSEEAEVRDLRSELLADCALRLDRSMREGTDWFMDTQEQAAWTAYRQALRDVPEQAGFPHDVTWPVKP